MTNSPETRVLVFAKAPEPGFAKTRLIDALGSGGAAVLAARMIRRTLATAVAANIGAIELWCAPHATHPLFSLCERDFGVTLHEQTGKDLGDRMSHALADALTRAHGAVLIGTDIPTLTPDDLMRAQAALQSGADAVLGRTEDGGYYLVGMRQHAAKVFSGITWSSDSVMRETRDRMRTLGWAHQEIAVRWDVDRPEDLRRVAADPSCASLLQQLSVTEPMDFARASNDTRAS